MAEAISKDARSYRLTNIDFLRGLVIVIMAIDHVRDFFLTSTELDPMTQPEAALSIYLTRWVTHFCAPVFVFLAGTSAGLMAARKSSAELGAFLFKRGLWLIFVEVAIISTSVTTSPAGMAEYQGATLMVFQVIWVIGASMILLAGLQFLGTRACLYLGAAIVLGHNLLDPLWPAVDITSGDSSLWALLFYPGSFILGPFFIWEIYPLAAWVGVMLLGFGSAFIFQQAPTQRDRQLTIIGVLCIVAFVLLRTSGIYGDANGWQPHELGLVATLRDYMNVSKYPPSLLFLLITLGPMAIVCARADRWSGWLKDTLVMFGRVPFAFYVAHFILIHILAVGMGVIQGFEASQFITLFLFFPEGYGISLLGVYLVWLLVLAILYPFCRWMADLKSRRKDWWLSYL